MRTNPKFTNFAQNKSGRWTHPSLIKTSYKKNHKILTQESPAYQQPFLSAGTITKDYANCYSNIFNQVTTSEVFVSVGPQPKDQQNSQKQTKANNKYILRNCNNKEQFTNSNDNKSDIFCKRSIQILIDIKPPMMQTKYSKISRRKEQFLKRSTINSSQANNNEIMQKIAKKIENPHSQEKLIDKYRELLQVKEKQPFNMINKLYQIDLLTAKEAVFCPKQVFKAATTKTNFKKKSSNIEIKNNQLWQKSKQSNNHNNDIIYGESSPFYAKQPDKSGTFNHFNPTRKLTTQQKCKQARQLRQNVSKNAKTTLQTPTNQTINSPARINQFKSNKYVHKKSEYQSLKTEANAKNQNLIILSLPKKISSTAFIIYEVFLDKNKAYPRKVQPQSKKKKQLNGQIHASFNIKSASEIASLTKIMTCIVIIQICEKLAINPQQQKYKIGVYQSTIRGTTADIQPGQIYTIHQLLHGLMLPSGNDASIALARWGGNVLLLSDNEGQKRKVIEKSEKGLINSHWLANNKFLRYREEKFKFRRCYNRFLAEMNKKARVLGLDRTNYVNSHGLSNPHNKSCCLDLANLCEYAMQNDYFRSIVGCKQYLGLIEQCVETTTIRNPKKRKESSTNLKIDEDPEQMNLLQDLQDQVEFNNESQDQDQTQADSLGCSNTKKQKEFPEEQRQISFVEKQIKWENTHRLLHKKDCYFGIKTGVTATAGACLASYVTIQARSFIIIVLNSKKLSLRFTDTELLRKWLIKKENLAQSVAKLDCGNEINPNQ